MSDKIRILHLITQDDQPYGSRRKCCEECGLIVDKCDTYVIDKRDFNTEAAYKHGLMRCIDKRKPDSQESGVKN